MHFEVRSRKINPDCLKTKLIYWFLTLEVRVGFDLVTEGHCQGSRFCPSFCSDAVRSSGGRGGLSTGVQTRGLSTRLGLLRWLKPKREYPILRSQRDPGGSSKASYDLALEISKCHFYAILLVT